MAVRLAVAVLLSIESMFLTCPVADIHGNGVGECRNFVKFNCNAYNKELGIGLGIKVAPTFFLYKNNVKARSSPRCHPLDVGLVRTSSVS